MNIEDFLDLHRLPAAFKTTATDFYVPLARWVEAQIKTHGQPGFVLGINGAQGTGKSTLSHFLCDYLKDTCDRSVVELSIDDIYLTRARRANLARTIHPLLMSRGVPGTHDILLGAALLADLRALRKGDSLAVPRFDKSADDRAPFAEWPLAQGPVDLIIFEGWCVGSMAQPDAKLEPPINDLEVKSDASGAWREYVNRQLRNNYAELFAQLDALVFLQVPDFDAVYRWRLEQEHKLRDSAGAEAAGVMSDDEVARFIQHFERITRSNSEQLPRVADVVIRLAENHAAVSAQYSGDWQIGEPDRS